jgi:acetyl esterase/lipase
MLTEGGGPKVAPITQEYAARCLQHVKYHAEKLGIDPDCILLTGGSAGGATSAWLAMRNDLADPDNTDPIAQVSTRALCSTPNQAQTSLDPIQMQKWIPGITYGAHAFHPDLPKDKTERFQYGLAHRDEVLDAIADFSAYQQASADDPPMMPVYGGRKDIPVADGGNGTHHPKFGEYLDKRLKELGVESYYWCDTVSSGVKRYDGWAKVDLFTLDKLLGPDWDQKKK